MKNNINLELLFMTKNIFLLWLQGWDKAPWLQKKVLESWKINNPSWDIILIDQKNIKPT